MRVLLSIGFVIALLSWSAETLLAAPTPFLRPQRAVPPSTWLTISGVSRGRQPQAATEGTLYSFGASPADGGAPYAALINVNGVLYGTTSGGGKYYLGTVFALTATGTERVLYSFGETAGDGLLPGAGLIDVNGVLYGTALEGGKYYRSSGGGTVFAVSASGTERVLHSFGNGTDGINPTAALVGANGVLYGTTYSGGKYGKGTAFAMPVAGTERVLHDFGKGTDGATPYAGLIDVNGVLYGTTVFGGRYGKGTVFEVTAAGTERVVYNFGTRIDDGAAPEAALVDVNGVLYGTTSSGGRYGGGIVFAISAAGTERVLHDFGNGTDAAFPVAALIDVNGTLYGTTSSGGTSREGTVFAITTAGTERVLRDFGFNHNPRAALIDVNGLLYGTSIGGGKYGAGTVFFQSP